MFWKVFFIILNILVARFTRWRKSHKIVPWEFIYFNIGMILGLSLFRHLLFFSFWRVGKERKLEKVLERRVDFYVLVILMWKTGFHSVILIIIWLKGTHVNWFCNFTAGKFTNLPDWSVFYSFHSSQIQTCCTSHNTSIISSSQL